MIKRSAATLLSLRIPLETDLEHLPSFSFPGAFLRLRSLEMPISESNHISVAKSICSILTLRTLKLFGARGARPSTPCGEFFSLLPMTRLESLTLLGLVTELSPEFILREEWRGVANLCLDTPDYVYRPLSGADIHIGSTADESEVVALFLKLSTQLGPRLALATVWTSSQPGGFPDHWNYSYNILETCLEAGSVSWQVLKRIVDDAGPGYSIPTLHRGFFGYHKSKIAKLCTLSPQQFNIFNHLRVLPDLFEENSLDAFYEFVDHLLRRIEEEHYSIDFLDSAFLSPRGTGVNLLLACYASSGPVKDQPHISASPERARIVSIALGKLLDQGRADVLDRLRVDINQREPGSGCTALHFARTIECLRALKRLNADPTVQSQDDGTPLQKYCTLAAAGHASYFKLADFFVESWGASAATLGSSATGVAVIQAVVRQCPREANWAPQWLSHKMHGLYAFIDPGDFAKGLLSSIVPIKNKRNQLMVLKILLERFLATPHDVPLQTREARALLDHISTTLAPEDAKTAAEVTAQLARCFLGPQI